jgi:hypothetical protein
LGLVVAGAARDSYDEAVWGCEPVALERMDSTEGCGLRGRQILSRTARDELEQQVVQLRDHPGVVLAECPPPVGQHAQQVELLVVDARAQTRHAGAEQGDGRRICGSTRRSRSPSSRTEAPSCSAPRTPSMRCTRVLQVVIASPRVLATRSWP